MYTFQEIMDFYDGNETVYNEIKKNLPNLVTFVGAGLTAFAYCGWGEALAKIFQRMKNDFEAKKRVEQQIASGEYLKAAQTIEDELTPETVAHEMEKLFTSDKLTEKMKELPKQAIYLLPKLFNGLVITTNFDQSIETVYGQEIPMFHMPVAHPGHSEWLSKRLYDTERGVFKLHGTVEGGVVEYGNIVFTARQYRRNYGLFSQLRRDLTECFKTRAMLFLGCSLAKDRTMSVLDKVTRKSEYKYNYAIVNCTAAEREARVKELEKRHIKAIVFETPKFEAVRVILEQLLKDTLPDEYDKLRYKIGALRMIRAKDRFSSENDSIPLAGRDRELNELLEFAEHDTNGGWWWTLTGSGGSGKSRLAHEMKKQLSPRWDVVNIHDYGNLPSPKTISRPTMFIADDAQTHAAQLGQWMTDLSGYAYPMRVRLLLVERDDNTDWIDSLLTNSGKRNEIADWHYRNDLKLKPLNDEELLKIINRYAEYLGDLGYTGWERVTYYGNKEILERLKQIDANYSRPLYALMLTDLFIDNANGADWKSDMFTEISDRERERVGNAIRDVLGANRENRELTEACLYLMSLSTVTGGITEDESKSPCGEKWEIIHRWSGQIGMEPEIFLRRVGASDGKRILPIKPDIIGEYAVLDWLTDQDRATGAEFLRRAWTKAGTGEFFRRLIRDYSDTINAVPEQWRLLFPTEFAPTDRDLRLEYAETLRWAIEECKNYEICDGWVNALRGFAREDGGVDFTAKLANGLAALCERVSLNVSMELVRELEKLYHRDNNKDVTNIAAAYARGLANLTKGSELDKCLIAVNQLHQVYEYGNNRNVTDIAAAYATGLYNRIAIQVLARQALDGCHITMEQLRQVYDYGNNRNVIDIAVQYAKGLVILIHTQELDECLETVEQLRHVYNYGNNKDVTDIAAVYANGLLNMTTKSELDGFTAEQFHQVYEYSNNRDVPDIAARYSLGLANLSNKQSREDCTHTVKRIEEIYNYRDNSGVNDITWALMRGTANLIEKTAGSDSRDIHKLFYKLENLYNENSVYIWAKEQYAYALASMCFVHPADAERSLPIVRRLWRENPESADIAARRATALFHSGNWQDVSELKTTVDEIEGLYKVYGQREKQIANTFALSLTMLWYKQSEKERPKTLTRLRTLLRAETISEDYITEICRTLHCSKEKLFSDEPIDLG